MKFTLKQILVFDAIAESSTVSAAAAKLNISQSAASMALAQLETLLGQSLFERNGKRLLLNSWGKWLRPKAKQLLLQAQQIELGLDGQHLLSGDLTLAASQTIAEHLVPQLICLLDQDFPGLRINLDVDNSEHVIAGVLDYQYELGIIEGRCDDDRLLQQVWCHDELKVIASRNHPFAKLSHVSLNQLEQALWVLREPGAGTRDVFDHAISHHVARLQVRREFNHVATLLAMVKSGPYLSCLPASSVDTAIEGGELVELKTELPLNRSFNFVWRKSSIDNPLIDCVIKTALRITT